MTNVILYNRSMKSSRKRQKASRPRDMRPKQVYKGGVPMYVASKRSSEKIVHNEGCRYAKMISPGNKQYFYTTEAAFKAGKTACIHCSSVMSQVPGEIKDLQNICDANDMGIMFDHSDGTLDVIAPQSEWKIADEGGKRFLRLYHRNTVDFDDGTSPYEGYHYQRVTGRSITEILQYIIVHDWYKIQEMERRERHRERISKRGMRPYYRKRGGNKTSKYKKAYTSRAKADYAACLALCVRE